MNKSTKLKILSQATKYIFKEKNVGLCYSICPSVRDQPGLRSIYALYRRKEFRDKCIDLFYDHNKATAGAFPSPKAYFFSYDMEGNHLPSEQAQSDRLLALAFMAAMVEAGDL